MYDRYNALILVGGKSSRMSYPKYKLKINNTTFLHRIENAFTSFETFYSVDRLLDDLPIDNQICDQFRNIGPIGGIYAGLEKSQAKFTFVASCDIPLLSPELVTYMLGQHLLHNKTLIARVDGKIIPTFGIYTKTDAKYFLRAIEDQDYKLMNLLPNIDTHFVDIPNIFNKQLTNINTITDLQRIDPFIFCVSGFKNSGKTTLITNLISKYKDHGYKVAVLKHDGHDFEINSGTDTGKFANTNCDIVTIYSNTKQNTLSTEGFSFESWLQTLNDIQVVIIEGLKDSCYPKIWLGEEANINNSILHLKNTQRDDIKAIFNKLQEVEHDRWK